MVLDEHGNLVASLLDALLSCGKGASPNVAGGAAQPPPDAGSDPAANAAARPELKSSAAISLIISLLSNLLRGSQAITEKIQR